MGWFLKHQKTVQNAYHDLRKPEGNAFKLLTLFDQKSKTHKH